ncbi:MAG: AraC family transcriptional regulator [bacterium]|nr:AraC family transcriptional regulator [bacterium]
MLTEFDNLVLPIPVSIGRSNFDVMWAREEHTDSCTELMFILQGSVEVRTAEFTVSAGEGDTVYTPSNVPHRDDFAKDKPFEVYLAQFHWAGETGLLKHFNPSQLIARSPSARQKIASEFHTLYQDFVLGLPLNRELVAASLLRIICYLCQEASIHAGSSAHSSTTAGSDRRAWIMNEARNYIQREFHRPVSLEEIAVALNISTYYLSHVFSQESGFTLSSYINEVRMQNAARLLSDYRLNISEVAQAAGFVDSSYFRKVFKAYYGCAPREYRSQDSIQK